MTHGLVIGKFMPVHKGHLALIHFAASHCDRLIVSMSYTPTDPISETIRFHWLTSLLADQPSIEIHKIADDFDDESLPLQERTKKWADVIASVYPKIDVLVSSEDYGVPFAHHLGAKHIPFDPGRKLHAVSATQIRTKPLFYWDYIPDVVRPYFVKKICFYGPESTGKSTMAKHFAEAYNTEFVPEVARELITSNSFNREDIIEIGRAQTERVFQKIKTANKFLFCDTDLITTQIYSRHYLKVVPPILYQLEAMVTYDHYFLFDIDVPWVADGLRDLGNQREKMMETFRHELETRAIPFTLISGSWPQREALIKEWLNRVLGKN
jgi:HTH-type transcriptional regulator, transcriptional repressor of NAD biosynthesis genes